MRILTLVFFTLFSHPAFGEKFSFLWVEKNKITLDQLFEISNESGADDKFQIATLLDTGSSLFKEENDSKIEAIRSVILHEAAATGSPEAQFWLSQDYKNGRNGFKTDKRLAELWLKKALQNGYDAKNYQSNLQLLQNRRAYSCNVDLITTTGMDRTEVTHPTWDFGLLVEYGDIAVVQVDTNRTEKFNCRDDIWSLTENYHYLQKQCFNERRWEIVQYFQTATGMTASDPSAANKLTYTWVVGLPDLSTIRQGSCELISDFKWD